MEVTASEFSSEGAVEAGAETQSERLSALDGRLAETAPVSRTPVILQNRVRGSNSDDPSRESRSQLIVEGQLSLPEPHDPRVAASDAGPMQAEPSRHSEFVKRVVASPARSETIVSRPTGVAGESAIRQTEMNLSLVPQVSASPAVNHAEPSAQSRFYDLVTFPGQPVVRPADTQSQILSEFPSVSRAIQAEQQATPVHVRIGKVEVRGTPVTAPERTAPTGNVPQGFASYQRLRRYRI